MLNRNRGDVATLTDAARRRRQSEGGSAAHHVEPAVLLHGRARRTGRRPEGVRARRCRSESQGAEGLDRVDACRRQRHLEHPGHAVSARPWCGPQCGRRGRRTALDWALTRGETEMSRFLRSSGEHALRPPLRRRPHRWPARAAPEAIARAVARLQPVGPAFNNRTKCNSCHNQNIPGIAITAAERRGIAIDTSLAGHSMEATTRQWNGRREAVLLGDTNGGGFQANGALLAAGNGRGATCRRRCNSDAIVIGIGIAPGARRLVRAGDRHPPAAHRQHDDGDGDGHYARCASTRRRDVAPKCTRVPPGPLPSSRTTTPRDTQERVFKMLGLLWGGGADAEIAREKAATG